MSEYVKSLGQSVILNDVEVLGGKEIDIYVPDKKVGIEFNGLYWHSNKEKWFEKGGSLKSRTYAAAKRHEEKQLLATAKGIRLIQIWEDEWRDRPTAVKSIIAAALGLGDRYNARECTVVVIDKILANEFLDNYHIQGAAKYASVSYALTYRGQVVAVMSFGKATSVRGNLDTSLWELMRFASVGRVRGGGSKLVKAFERDHPEVTQLVSYCDKRLFEGRSYIQYGFEKVADVPPDYTVVEFGKRPIRHHKAWAKKELLRSRYELPEDNRTELELTDAVGLARVYDCGKTKYLKVYN